MQIKEGFETRLIDSLQPIRNTVLAISLYQLFDTGLFDELMENGPLSVQHISNDKELDETRLAVFLKYLRNEGILTETDGLFALSAKGKSYGDFRAWYIMMIGGYTETFLQMGEKIKQGAGCATRNTLKVGVGSCGISNSGTIPMARKLMALAPGKCTRLLDIGCGNALYLVDFCRAIPEIEFAWGVEPSKEGCREAVNLVRENNLQHKVNIINTDAADFFHSDYPCDPDFVVIGFVLHEILGQEGKSGVMNFLVKLIKRFPDLHLIVIEVDNVINDPCLMQHGLSLAYYNPYYLLHPFSDQRLETQAFWDNLFEECQLEILAREALEPHLDSTGLEIGYLLHKKEDR